MSSRRIIPLGLALLALFCSLSIAQVDWREMPGDPFFDEPTGIAVTDNGEVLMLVTGTDGLKLWRVEPGYGFTLVATLLIPAESSVPHTGELSLGGSFACGTVRNSNNRERAVRWSSLNWSQAPMMFEPTPGQEQTGCTNVSENGFVTASQNGTDPEGNPGLVLCEGYVEVLPTPGFSDSAIPATPNRDARVIVGSAQGPGGGAPPQQPMLWRRSGFTGSYSQVSLHDPYGINGYADAVKPSGATDLICGSVTHPTLGGLTGCWRNVTGEFEYVGDWFGWTTGGEVIGLLADNTLVINGPPLALLAHLDLPGGPKSVDQHFAESNGGMPPPCTIVGFNQVTYANGMIHGAAFTACNQWVYLSLPGLGGLNPMDPTLIELQVTADGTRISWEHGAVGTEFDIATGGVEDFFEPNLARGGCENFECAECPMTGGTNNFWLDPRSEPEPGKGFWYLISAESTVSATGFGNGTSRSDLSCP